MSRTFDFTPGRPPEWDQSRDGHNGWSRASAEASAPTLQGSRLRDHLLRLTRRGGQTGPPARILAVMETTSANARPRHANSPFQPHPEPVVEAYVVDDRVCHDSYGLGRVVGVDGGGATVDFTSLTVRIATPFRKMTKL